MRVKFIKALLAILRMDWDYMLVPIPPIVEPEREQYEKEVISSEYAFDKHLPHVLNIIRDNGVVENAKQKLNDEILHFLVKEGHITYKATTIGGTIEKIRAELTILNKRK